MLKNLNFFLYKIMAIVFLILGTPLEKAQGMVATSNANRNLMPHDAVHGASFHKKARNRGFDQSQARISKMALPSGKYTGDVRWWNENDQNLQIQTKGKFSHLEMIPAGDAHNILTQDLAKINIYSLDKNPSASKVVINLDSFETSRLIHHKGILNSNQEVVLANPEGFVFENGSQVNVAKLAVLVGGKIDIKNDNIHMNTIDHPDAVFINQGEINITDAGLSSFVAPHVAHFGKIVAKRGDVQLVSGISSVDFYGDGLIQFETKEIDIQKAEELTKEHFDEKGLLLINSKQALKTIQNIVNIKQTPMRAQIKGGDIIIGDATVVNLNKTDIIAKKGKEGGRIKVQGKIIKFDEKSTLNANGNNKGGRILIGGDFQGNLQNHTFKGDAGNLTPQEDFTIVAEKNAHKVIIPKGTKITATGSEKAGEFVVWSGQKTNDGSKTYMNATTDLTSKTGYGGAFEVSSKGEVVLPTGTLQLLTKGAKGQGLRLIDPAHLVFATSAPNSTGTPWETSTTTIAYTRAGATTNLTDVSASNTVSWMNPSSIQAGDTYAVDGWIVVASPIGSISGSLTLQGAQGIQVNTGANIAVTGDLTLTSSVGSINLTGTGDSNTHTGLSLSAQNITINAQAATITGNGGAGAYGDNRSPGANGGIGVSLSASNALSINTTENTGMFTITGTAGAAGPGHQFVAGSNGGMGVYLYANMLSIISPQFTINGTGGKGGDADPWNGSTSGNGGYGEIGVTLSTNSSLFIDAKTEFTINSTGGNGGDGGFISNINHPLWNTYGGAGGIGLYLFTHNSISINAPTTFTINSTGGNGGTNGMNGTGDSYSNFNGVIGGNGGAGFAYTVGTYITSPATSANVLNGSTGAFSNYNVYNSSQPGTGGPALKFVTSSLTLQYSGDKTLRSDDITIATRLLENTSTLSYFGFVTTGALAIDSTITFPSALTINLTLGGTQISGLSSSRFTTLPSSLTLITPTGTDMNLYNSGQAAASGVFNLSEFISAVGTSIPLTFQSGGNLTIASALSSVTNPLTLISTESGENINVSSNITSSSSITLNSGATIRGNGSSLTTNGALYLTSVGDIGSSGTPLAVSVSGNVTLNSGSTGNIYLTSNSALSLGAITTTSGALQITTTGSSHDITFNNSFSAGTIDLTIDPSSAISGTSNLGTISLTLNYSGAQTLYNGTSGSTSNHLEDIVALLRNPSNLVSLSFTTTNGNALTIDTNGANFNSFTNSNLGVSLTSGAALSGGLITTTGTGGLSLTGNGNIQNSGSALSVSVAGGNLVLNTTGIANIISTNALSLGSISATGALTLSTSGAMTFNNNTSASSISLSSGAGISGAGTLTTTSGDLTLSAAGDIGSLGAKLRVNIHSGNALVITASQNTYISSASSALKLGNITAVNLTLDAATYAITQKGSTNLTLTDALSISNAASASVLSKTANLALGNISTTNGLTIDATGYALNGSGLSFSGSLGITGATSATLSFVNTMTFEALNSTNALSLTTSAGDMNFNGAVSASSIAANAAGNLHGTGSLSTTNGNLTLSSGGDIYGASDESSHPLNISVTSGNLSITSAGKVYITSTGALSLGASTTSSDMNITSGAGITLAGNLTASGNVSLTGTSLNRGSNTIKTGPNSTLNLSSGSSPMSIAISGGFISASDLLALITNGSTSTSNVGNLSLTGAGVTVSDAITNTLHGLSNITFSDTSSSSVGVSFTADVNAGNSTLTATSSSGDITGTGTISTAGLLTLTANTGDPLDPLSVTYGLLTATAEHIYIARIFTGAHTLSSSNFNFSGLHAGSSLTYTTQGALTIDSSIAFGPYNLILGGSSIAFAQGASLTGEIKSLTLNLSSDFTLYQNGGTADNSINYDAVIAAINPDTSLTSIGFVSTTGTLTIGEAINFISNATDITNVALGGKQLILNSYALTNIENLTIVTPTGTDMFLYNESSFTVESESFNWYDIHAAAPNVQSVTFKSGGKLTLAQNITNVAIPLTLTAAGDIAQSSGTLTTSNENLNLLATGNIYGSTGSNPLSINLGSGTLAINAVAANIISSPALNLGTVSTTGALSIATSGVSSLLTVTSTISSSNNPITLSSADGITTNASSTISAGWSTLNITTSAGNMSFGDNLTASTITLDSAATISKLNDSITFNGILSITNATTATLSFPQNMTFEVLNTSGALSLTTTNPYTMNFTGNVSASSLTASSGGELYGAGILSTTSGNLSLTAGGNISKTSGGSDALTVGVVGGNLVLSTVNHDIYITSAQPLSIGAITTTSGDLQITTTGTANNLIFTSVVEAGSITLTTDPSSSISGKSLLNATRLTRNYSAAKTLTQDDFINAFGLLNDLSNFSSLEFQTTAGDLTVGSHVNFGGFNAILTSAGAITGSGVVSTTGTLSVQNGAPSSINTSLVNVLEGKIGADLTVTQMQNNNGTPMMIQNLSFTGANPTTLTINTPAPLSSLFGFFPFGTITNTGGADQRILLNLSANITTLGTDSSAIATLASRDITVVENVPPSRPIRKQVTVPPSIPVPHVVPVPPITVPPVPNTPASQEQIQIAKWSAAHDRASTTLAKIFENASPIASSLYTLTPDYQSIVASRIEPSLYLNNNALPALKIKNYQMTENFMVYNKGNGVFIPAYTPSLSKKFRKRKN